MAISNELPARPANAHPAYDDLVDLRVGVATNRRPWSKRGAQGLMRAPKVVDY